MTTNIKPKDKNLFDRNSWATPQWLYSWLDSVFNFDVDLCADEENAKHSDFLTLLDDSLSIDWSKDHKVGFCNPPYSNIKPWVEKALEQSKRGFKTVLVIPAPNGEKYYSKVITKAASISFITGRVAFYNPHEKDYIAGNTRGTCVVVFSPCLSSSPMINSFDRDSIIRAFS